MTGTEQSRRGCEQQREDAEMEAPIFRQSLADGRMSIGVLSQSEMGIAQCPGGWVHRLGKLRDFQRLLTDETGIHDRPIGLDFGHLFSSVLVCTCCWGAVCGVPKSIERLQELQSGIITSPTHSVVTHVGAQYSIAAQRHSTTAQNSSHRSTPQQHTSTPQHASTALQHCTAV